VERQNKPKIYSAKSLFSKNPRMIVEFKLLVYPTAIHFKFYLSIVNDEGKINLPN